jgi:hypothetical protein
LGQKKRKRGEYAGETGSNILLAEYVGLHDYLLDMHIAL